MARTLLEISRELAAISQAGLTYSRDPFDRERFDRLREIASELLRELPGKADFAWTPEDGYGTPKVDVRALVIREGEAEEILLVREKSTGRWSLPGGWADVNLTPAENVRKECLEEAGIAVTVERLVSVIDRERAGHRPPIPWSVYKLYFLCAAEPGAVPVAGPEVTEARFFSRAALPDDLDLGRIAPEEIERGFRHRGDATLPVFFQG